VEVTPRRAFVLGFLLVGMLLPADLAQAQRGAAIADPPLLGWFTLDSAAVTATAEVGSAEWPEFWVEALADARKCSGVKGDILDWKLYTVTSGFDGFRMKFWDRGNKKWAEAVFWGWTFPDRREIYVAQVQLLNYRILKHEMLHAILADRGMDYWHGSGLADGMFQRCFPVP
jgi:hypothetical protein